MCEIAKQTANKSCSIKVNTTDTLSAKYSIPAITEMIVKYNQIVKFVNTLYTVTSDADRHYDSSTASTMDSAFEFIKNVGFRIRGVKKIMSAENPGMTAAIPELEKLVKNG